MHAEADTVKEVLPTRGWLDSPKRLAPDLFREPSLKTFDGQKKTIQQLAKECGLKYEDGKVG